MSWAGLVAAFAGEVGEVGEGGALARLEDGVGRGAGLGAVEGGGDGDESGGGEATAGDDDLGAALDLVDERGEAVLGFVKGDLHGVLAS
jgi:hypothetical protein